LPPGHNKGSDPQDRPCTGGKSDQGNGTGGESRDDKGKDDKGKPGEVAGGVILMPLGLVGLAAAVVRPRQRGPQSERWLHGRRRAR
jgi:hypothetical protein